LEAVTIANLTVSIVCFFFTFSVFRRSDYQFWATDNVRSPSPIWLYQFLRSSRSPIWFYQICAYFRLKHQLLPQLEC